MPIAATPPRGGGWPTMMLPAVVLLFGVVVSAVASASANDGSWTLHKLTTAAASARGAVCLDGSPAAYYLRQPLVSPPTDSDSNSRRYVIFFEGGGWCPNDANCLSRAGADLGSSINYPPSLPAGYGRMQGTALYAEFDTATVVYVKYCDGSSFTSNVDDPVTVSQEGSTQTIYYRGRRILDALFEELLTQRGLDTATELLLAGCSAGALTTYIHADTISEIMKRRGVPGVKVVALADAMFSLQHDAYPANPNNHYTRVFRWGFEAWNASGSINQKCLAAHSSASAGGAWVCFHGAVAAQYVTTPLFIADSKYDTWQARGVLGLDCTSLVNATDGTVTLCDGTSPEARAQEQFWIAYGDAVVAALQDPTTLISKRHAAFLVNCPTHCQSDPRGWRHPAFPGTRLGAAVRQWYPLALANVDNGSWVAPRWVARNGDKCLVVPAAAPPTNLPAPPPTSHPTASPSAAPSGMPSPSPSVPESASPSMSPSWIPTRSHSSPPSRSPVSSPEPSANPTASPVAKPIVSNASAKPTAVLLSLCLVLMSSLVTQIIAFF